MEALFGSFFCIFEEFFGIPLANYLWNDGAFTGYGLTMFGISLAMVLLYYYVIDHPRLSSWWGWLIFLVTNALINFLVSWQWMLSNYYSDETEMSSFKDHGVEIIEDDILCFGVADMLLSILVFTAFSFIFKWWSNNSSHSPI